MKSHIKIITVLFILMTSCVILPRQSSAQQTNISFQVFYDQLSPYGQWIDYSDYGYVWLPDAGDDFVPYSSNGHWILSEYGWTWTSDYNWGWAAFHYGRWSFDDSFGWFWVPDTEWGPAWVSWREADGYYGWAPMEPGINANSSFGREYDSRNDHWIFVDYRNFDRKDINHYYVNQSDHDRIVRRSTTINRSYIDNERRTTYVSGPSREAVQQATGRTIKPLTIFDKNKPGQQINNNQLQIYRPQVEKNNTGVKRIAPTRVSNMNNVRRIQENGATNQNRNVKPENTVIPENNYTQPFEPRTVDKQNKPEQKNTVPENQNREVKQVETPISTPVNRDKQERQQNVSNPQNNSVQPVQQRNVQQQNNKPEQKTIAPAKTENKPQPEQNQRANQNTDNKPVRETKSIKQQVRTEQEKTENPVQVQERR